MMAYIGRKQCGCVVVAIVDNPRRKTQVSRTVAAWINDGLTVERVTADYVRANFIFDDCPHELKQRALFGEEGE